MSILMSHMMVTKNPQNVHRKCFWTILVTFIFDIKIDVNMCEPHYVNLLLLWTFSIVCVFDFLTFDIFLTFWHLFDIFYIFFNLNHLSPSQGYFYLPFENFWDLWFSLELRNHEFFGGCCESPCMGWEAKIDMSGQCNDCQRVCYVKMKKKLLEQKWGTFLRMYGLWCCSVNQFKFFS